MNNEETAAHLRKWVKTIHGLFAWPTDECGYDQHIKFVNHRNKNWAGNPMTWNKFVMDYADALESAPED